MELAKGIKETKEVLKLALVLSVMIKDELKDGAQFFDLLAIVGKIQASPEKKAMIDAAMKDVSLVSEEVKDISFAEGFELLGLVATELLGAKEV
jgi:hypothetical protein